MAHVELSLSGARLPVEPEPPDGRGTGTLDRWAETVRHAPEPCLVVDAAGVIVASSASCAVLLNLGDPADIEGSYLLDGALRLLDFSAARAELGEAELDKIPPVLALSSGRLARGLMRVQCRRDASKDATIDAIATPLSEGGTTVGSLTFFLAI